MTGDQTFYIALLTPILVLISTIALSYIGLLQKNKLDGIHTLVNSNLTTSIQLRLEALIRELTSSVENIALRRITGTEPTTEVIEALERTRAEIAELHIVLADRRFKENIR